MARRQSDALKQLLSDKHREYATSLNRVALLHYHVGEYARAEPLFVKVLSVFESSFGLEHPDSATVLDNLGLVYTNTGRFEEAVSLHRQAVEIRNKLLGEQSLEYATSLNNLAIVYLATGDYRRARPLLEQASQVFGRVLGEQSPSFATNLDNLAAVRQYTGNYAGARSLFQKAIHIRRQTLGERHPDYARSLHNLAGVQQIMGDYEMAETLYQQALDIRGSVLGKRAPAYAESLHNLAALYQTTGRYAQAKSFYEEAREILKQALGEQHPTVAQSANHLARLHLEMGEVAAAETLFQEALSTTQQILGENHAEFGMALNNLAELYRATGRYSESEPLYRRSLEILTAAVGDRHPYIATVCSNRGALCQLTGDLVKAESLHRRAREVRRRVFGEVHPEYAVSLANLATLYAAWGDFARAMPLSDAALTIFENSFGNEHPSYAVGLNNHAMLYQVMGDRAKAVALHRQVLAIRKLVPGEHHPDYAISLNNLGELYRSMREFGNAEPLLRDSLDTLRESLGTNHAHTASVCSNLSLLYQDMGAYGRAETLCEQAREIRETVVGREHPLYPNSLHNAAELHREKGDYRRAQSLYREAIEITTKALGAGHLQHATHRNRLGMLFLRMGNYRQADTQMRQALAIGRRHLELASVVQSERQQLAMVRQLRHFWDGYFSLVVESGIFGESAYRELLAWKGSITRRQRMVRSVGKDPRLQPLFAQLQRVASQLASLAYATPNPGQQAPWHETIRKLSDEKERLQRELFAQSRDFRQATRQPSLEDIFDILPPNVSVVDFLEYRRTRGEKEAAGEPFEQHLLAFVLRDRRVFGPFALGPVDVIDQAIDTWRRDYGQSKETREAGQFLRERIWDPLVPRIQDAKTILVSPDGVTSRLPLGALPGGNRNRFLLEEWPVAVVPTLAELPDLLADVSDMEPVEGNMLLVGGIDYDTSDDADGSNAMTDHQRRRVMRRGDRLQFLPLDGTKGELASIEESYRDNFGSGGITTLQAARASEDAVRREAPRHRYLHVATHGFFAPPEVRSALARDLYSGATMRVGYRWESLVGYHPNLLSGLALSGANNPRPRDDDGILTAEEVSAMDLSGVELAVLSACETGLGQVAGGEGLLGLQRAFQVAGVRTIVASLWKVPDAATRDLMERFYENLWTQEMDTLSALREAQLWMLNERGTNGLAPLDERGTRGLVPIGNATKTARRKRRLEFRIRSVFVLDQGIHALRHLGEAIIGLVSAACLIGQRHFRPLYKHEAQASGSLRSDTLACASCLVFRISHPKWRCPTKEGSFACQTDSRPVETTPERRATTLSRRATTPAAPSHGTRRPSAWGPEPSSAAAIGARGSLFADDGGKPLLHFEKSFRRPVQLFGQHFLVHQHFG